MKTLLCLFYAGSGALRRLRLAARRFAVAVRLATVAAATLLALGACAQDPITIIKEGVTKVIKAVDLQVQRIQTATIGLQEVQKEVENTMSALRLDEIR